MSFNEKYLMVTKALFNKYLMQQDIHTPYVTDFTKKQNESFQFLTIKSNGKAEIFYLFTTSK
ncbi:hypothetical protein GCM10028805_55530 [Spirosoma harenae]